MAMSYEVEFRAILNFAILKQTLVKKIVMYIER